MPPAEGRFLSRLRTAIGLIATGKWRTLASRWRHLRWRRRLSLRGIDLDVAAPDELACEQTLRGRQGHTVASDLERVLKAIGIPPGARVMDFGCGKGAALIAMAKFPFARIAGIDLSPKICRIAEENLAKMGVTNAVVHCGDATTFTDLDEYDYAYFYNPFLRPLFDAAMENIKASLIRRPRDMTIIYYHPICHEVVVAGGVFEKVREFYYGELLFFVYVHKMAKGE